LNESPEGNAKESVMGLKESFPENAMAVTTMGEARKFIVRLLPSLRDLKLLRQKKTKFNQVALKIQSPYRLKEVRIALDTSTYIPRNSMYDTPFAPSSVSSRFHYTRQDVNIHLIQKSQHSVPAQCKARRHSPGQRPQRPQVSL